MYLSLARKYRPRTFADVAVQTHVSNTLRGAIARGRVAHGYLLCGPRGVGKTTLARVLAMALNCENRSPDGEPCGVCASCTRIWAGSASLDVIEIDAASNRGVDDARDLRERAMYAPSGDDRYKVYIVDEAHMLTREAWNALLKILEEPPPRVVFVFATTEPQKITQTAAPVMSRLQRFDFKRIGTADVRARLATVLAAEHIEAEPDALTLLARAADGSMRDALSLADQSLSLGDGTLTAQRVRDALGLVPEDEVLALIDIIAEHRAADVFPAVARLADAGADLGLFLGALGEGLRAALAMSLGGSGGDLSDTLRDGLAARVSRFTPGDLVRMLTAITDLEPKFRRSGQQQILLETVLVRFALQDRTVSIEDVLREMGPGGPSGAGGAAPRPPVGPRPAPLGDAPPPRERKSAPAPAPATGAADTSRQSPPEPTADPRPAAVLADAPPEPAPDPAPPVASIASPIASSPPPPPAQPSPPRERVSVASLTSHWDDVVSRLRAEGRMNLAGAVDHTHPVSVSNGGEITLELPSTAEFFREPLTAQSAEILSVIGTLVAGATRLTVRLAAAPAADAPSTRRFTEESVRRDRLSMLRKKDPTLDAAVDTLDLELLE
ncbi:MAG TPA: DNA polymerase III subunit gamma/tau [Gemmatimonadaceae bacterium]|nr:DNA polymerase III subunit gamma/tau [Gemmatimonadaceae bacterium]